MSKRSQQMEPQDFVKTVRKSGILSDNQFSSWLKKINLSNSQNRKSTNLLSKDLLENGLVTPWQCEKLLNGKYKGFFIGQYKILNHLGSGGMSAVYLAEQELTGQLRAIKVLPKDKLKEKSYLARFYREAQAVAAINHPNIVRVYDIAKGQGTHYMVMEYASGSDLHRTVTDNGPFSFELAENCIRQTAIGLAAAHEKDIVHRDVKPANLMLSSSKEVKILDLGLALLKSNQNNFDISAQHNESVMGTVDFLAPEQAINSHNIDHRADIYSLGCTLYFLLTGNPPFPSGTLAQRIAAHQSQAPPNITSIRPDCPSHLESICKRMLNKKPADRFGDCQEIINSFQSPLVPVATHPSFNSRSATKPIAVRKKRNSVSLWLITAGLLALTCTLGTLLYIRGQDEIGSKNVPMTTGNKVFNSAHSAPSIEPQSQTSANDRLQELPPTAGEHYFNFDDRETFRRTSKGLQLISNNELIGHLENRDRNDFRSLTYAKSENHCLWIAQGTKVPFRPLSPEQRLKKFTIDIYPHQTSGKLNVTISAKESLSGNDPWQTLRDISPELQPDKFSQIALEPDLFTTMNYRKFRIDVAGAASDGIYIRSLSINFQ